MIIIINDDEIYLRWIEENQNGFVVNAKNPPTPDYLMLHRSSCNDISSRTRSNWTTTDYLKVCCNDVVELEAWALETVRGQLTPCQHCRTNE